MLKMKVQMKRVSDVKRVKKAIDCTATSDQNGPFYSPCLTLLNRSPARQAKKEFKLRRGSHYSGEGEMMKRFRAGILDLDDEDEEGGGGGGGAEDTNEDESAIDIDDAPTQNGSAHVNGQGNTSSRSGRRIPPVPPLPNGSA